MKNNIICILHQHHSKVRRVGFQLDNLDLKYKDIRPCIGEPLPKNVKSLKGVVIFGGPMSVYEQSSHEFLKLELLWIEKLIKYEIPIFGICLGAQLIAKALGASVVSRYNNEHEIGYYPVLPIECSKHLFNNSNQFYAYQWHKDTFEVPKSAKLVATGKTFKNQAFIYNSNILAVQFHPDLTLRTMLQWSVFAKKKGIKGVQKEKKLRETAIKNEPKMRRWLKSRLEDLFIKNKI